MDLHKVYSSTANTVVGPTQPYLANHGTPGRRRDVPYVHNYTLVSLLGISYEHILFSFLNGLYFQKHWRGNRHSQLCLDVWVLRVPGGESSHRVRLQAVYQADSNIILLFFFLYLISYLLLVPDVMFSLFILYCRTLL